MVVKIDGNNVILKESVFIDMQSNIAKLKFKERVFNNMQRKIGELEIYISVLVNQLEKAKNKTVVEVQVKNEISEAVSRHLNTKFNNLMTQIEEIKKLGVDVDYLNDLLKTIDTHIEDRIKEMKTEIEFETTKFLAELKNNVLSELGKKFDGNVENFFEKKLTNAINHIGGRYDDKVKILFDHTIKQLIGKTKINLLKGVPSLSLVHQNLLKQAMQKASMIENQLSKKSVPTVEFKNGKE